MSKPLMSIDAQAIAVALGAVHQSAPYTARRTLAGVAAVLRYAKAAGLRTGDNPATFRDNFLDLWGRGRAAVHWRAADYRDIPEIYRRLLELDATAAACLRFAILTGVRTSNALFATWAEIDLGKRQWTIPAERMKVKGREAFVVPLAPEAIAIMEAMRERFPNSNLVFPSDRHRGRQHSRALQHVLQRTLGIDVSVYGFRSSMRDFLGDQTNVERDVAEMCLAHFAKGVEAAYRRTTALEKRRIALDLWASHVVGGGEADVVTPFRLKRS